MAHFVEAFWTEEFCSTAGIELVIKRMKDGNTVCKNIISYLRQRAKAESDYAASLQKIIKCTDFSLETGALGQSLEVVKQALARISEEHHGSNRQMNECADRLQAFADRQKTERAKEEKAMMKMTQKKHLYYKECSQAKRSYYQAALEADKAEDEVIKAKPNMNSIPTKEWEKIINTSAKAKRDSGKADDNYKKCVRQLEDTRHQWEKDLERFFAYCERQEIDRIKTLQNEIWTHSNITSMASVEDDESCEEVRVALEDVEPQKDVQSFVQNNFIGSQRPASVVYEPYASSNQASDSDLSTNQSAITSALQARTTKTLLPQNSAVNKNNNHSGTISGECDDIEPYSTCTRNIGKIPQQPVSSSHRDIPASIGNVKDASSNLSTASQNNGSMQNINLTSESPRYSPVQKPKPPRSASIEEANPAYYANVNTNSTGNTKFNFSTSSPPLKAPKPTGETEKKKSGPMQIWKTKTSSNVATTSKITKI